jgi:membrane-bound lytic murein transglycosylase A
VLNSLHEFPQIFKGAMGLLAAVFLFFLLSPGAGNGQTRAGNFPVFRDDLDRDTLHRAIHRSLEFVQRLPPDRTVGEWPRKFTAREVKESLLTFLGLLGRWDRPKTLAQEIRSHFEIFESAGNQAEGDALFTGYYQVVIDGSLRETEEYRFPLYRKPSDLIEAEQVTLRPEATLDKVVGRLDDERFVPYFSRHEIDGLGRLNGKGYEIAWVKDPVQRFFLHIQGSGLLRLEDGRLLHVNYAGSNGRPYRSIGMPLIDSGKIPRGELSMSRLRRYLKEHPEERDALLAHNESYVFFRFVTEGPLGSLGVPLTPGRSIATDARLYPKGALAFIASRKPVLNGAGKLVGWRPFSRFVVNQDTGSAIRGPGRVDLYFGSGEEAGARAGHMKNAGKLHFLMKKK